MDTWKCGECEKLYVVGWLGSWKKLEGDWNENLGPDHNGSFGFIPQTRGSHWKF